jgi:integrase
MRLFKNYRPARIINGYRTYIEYWSQNPITGKFERFRETYGLNRIKNKKERQQKAKEYRDQINDRLPKGFPFQEEHEKKKKKISLIDAMNTACKIKCQTDSKGTQRTYKSNLKLFVDWVRKEGYADMHVFEFEHKHALEYMDYWVVEHNITNNTYNNKRSKMRGMFEELIEREYIETNPFAKIKRKVKNKKIKDMFEPEEMELVADYYKKHRPWMYKALLLQFYCWIRPEELRRLRFSHFDLRRGIIKLPGSVTKNNDDSNITIPKAILKEFVNPEFAAYNYNWYVFGSKLKPARSQCGERSMNSLHNTILEKLGIKRPGLVWYSWKDTGMTILSEKLQPRDLQKHARHSNLEITENYLHNSGKIIEAIRGITERIV